MTRQKTAQAIVSTLHKKEIVTIDCGIIQQTARRDILQYFLQKAQQQHRPGNYPEYVPFQISWKGVANPTKTLWHQRIVVLLQPSFRANTRRTEPVQKKAKHKALSPWTMSITLLFPPFWWLQQQQQQSIHASWWQQQVAQWHTMRGDTTRWFGYCNVVYPILNNFPTPKGLLSITQEKEQGQHIGHLFKKSINRRGGHQDEEMLLLCSNQWY